MRNNWSGDGTIYDTTAGIDVTCIDDYMVLDCPRETMVSEPWYLGSGAAVIQTNVYGPGSGTPDIQFRTGATKAACLSASYAPYFSGFISLGWVQIKVTNDI